MYVQIYESHYKRGAEGMLITNSFGQGPEIQVRELAAWYQGCKHWHVAVFCLRLVGS